MSHNHTLPFSVAKLAIEVTGEGAFHSCSAPPRLSSSQNDTYIEFPLRFAINPFSLSRSSYMKSHASHFPPYSPVNRSPASSPSLSTSSSQSPVSISHLSSSSASVSSSSPSPRVHSLFPNPFVITQNSQPQPALIIPKKSVTTSGSPLSPNHAHTQNIISTGSSSTPRDLPTHPETSYGSTTRKPHRPRPDRVLASSPFRPRVMAVDRLLSWRTPYGLSHDSSLMTELPSALVESAKMSITGALAISSRSTYAAGLLRFSQFCDRWQISEDARMPASYALLCAFIGNYKGTISGKTIKSWLSGIRAWHFTNHAPWYGDDKWVQMARISANKEGSRHKRPLRAPVSIEHLLALRRAIDISTHFHAAIWAVALVTFFGCRRLGETTVSSASSFNPDLHVLRSAEYVYLQSTSLTVSY